MAKRHAIQAAQKDLFALGISGEVADVQLAPVGRVLIKLRDGQTITVDRWMAVKLRTLLQQRYPRLGVSNGDLREDDRLGAAEGMPVQAKIRVADSRRNERRLEIAAAILMALLAAFLASP